MIFATCEGNSWSWRSSRDWGGLSFSFLDKKFPEAITHHYFSVYPMDQPPPPPDYGPLRTKLLSQWCAFLPITIYERLESTRNKPKGYAISRKVGNMPERVRIPLRPPSFIGILPLLLDYGPNTDQSCAWKSNNWSLQNRTYILLAQNLLSIRWVR